MSVADPSAARLRLVLAESALVWPESGRIGVFGPRAGADLSLLPKSRVQVITGFRPDHDAFATAGWDVAPAPEGRFAAALVCLPRARAAARDLIARVVDLCDGPVLVDGQKTDGVDSVLRDCRAVLGGSGGVIIGPHSKAHGKIFALAKAPAAAFAQWRAVPARLPGGFVTVPGVFSADGVDPGSAALAAALPNALPGIVADLGAGWGWLAAQILAREGVRALHLVEADYAALDCARQNIRDPRAQFHWADANRFEAPEPVGAVVMNPPFHKGRAGDPLLGTDFIAASARILAPQGVLWMVANRHLPYEAALDTHFREFAEIAGSSAFKIIRARLPRRGVTRHRR